MEAPKTAVEAPGLEFFDQPIKSFEDTRQILNELRKLSVKALRTLFEKYVGQKPSSYDDKILRPAIAYTLMARSTVYGEKGETPRIKEERERAITLCTRGTEETPQMQKPAAPAAKAAAPATPPAPAETKPKKQKVDDELAKKLAGKTLAEIVKIAESLGVKGAAEQLKRPPGLASMWLRNQIRCAQRAAQRPPPSSKPSNRPAAQPSSK